MAHQCHRISSRESRTHKKTTTNNVLGTPRGSCVLLWDWPTRTSNFLPADTEGNKRCYSDCDSTEHLLARNSNLWKWIEKVIHFLLPSPRSPSPTITHKQTQQQIKMKLSSATYLLSLSIGSIVVTMPTSAAFVVFPAQNSQPEPPWWYRLINGTARARNRWE